MRFELPEQKRLTHELVLPIRWGDMDAMGHVNNTLTSATWRSRAWSGCSIAAAPDPSGFGPVIVNAFCNFIRQLEYPGVVLAKHYVANPGRSSFDTFITLERADAPGRLYAEGGAKTVWTDFKAQKSAPMPDWLRSLLVPAQG